MRATVDSVGRVLIPKKLRDALGIKAGSTVDISWYGTGLQLTPGGRGGHFVEEDGISVLAATGEPLTDEMMYALIEEGRR